MNPPRLTTLSELFPCQHKVPDSPGLVSRLAPGIVFFALAECRLQQVERHGEGAPELPLRAVARLAEPAADGFDALGTVVLSGHQADGVPDGRADEIGENPFFPHVGLPRR